MLFGQFSSEQLRLKIKESNIEKDGPSINQSINQSVSQSINQFNIQQRKQNKKESKKFTKLQSLRD